MKKLLFISFLFTCSSGYAQDSLNVIKVSADTANALRKRFVSKGTGFFWMLKDSSYAIPAEWWCKQIESRGGLVTKIAFTELMGDRPIPYK